MIKRLKLKIPASLINEPIIYKMVTMFELMPNILAARLENDSEGEVLIEIKGSPVGIEQGLNYLRSLDIQITEE